MEFVIVLLMAACCFVALKTGRESLTVKLGALSVNVAAAFAIVMFQGGSALPSPSSSSIWRFLPGWCSGRSNRRRSRMPLPSPEACL